MPNRIVLFGATGYTGQLTARALVAQGARPVLAGRRASPLRALASELGDLEIVLADAEDQGTLRAVLTEGDVLASCVGPFSHLGKAPVEAAIAKRAHYLDCTGEPAFIRRVFDDYGLRAEAAGVALLPATGYDWLPGNLAAALALQEAGRAARAVHVGYFATGPVLGGTAMSGGTRASAAAALFEPGFAFRDGELVPERGGLRARTFPLRGTDRGTGLSVAAGEHLMLPRLHPGLREVDVHLGWFGRLSKPLQLVTGVGDALLHAPGVRAGASSLARKLVTGSTGGPDAAARGRSGSVVVAEVRDGHDRLLGRVRLGGVNGYDFTASILAWGARFALAGGLKATGALGPVEAFGLKALERGAREAGLVREL